jgi:carboxypeptidase PM20D1
MLEALSPSMSIGRRMMVQNRWLFGPILLRSLAETADGNALIRTTTAVTMFNSGVKDNVLPAEATAVVNFRILPGDTVASVLEHVRAVVADDRVKVARYGELAADPSPVSPVDAPAFKLLKQTVRQFFPGAILVPNLLVARTDSARYYAITDNVYKFFPAIRDEADAARVHGTNERLGTADYMKAIQFMASLMRSEALK